MEHKKLYQGFDEKKQKEYEEYLIETGKVTRSQIDESWETMKNSSFKDGNQIKDAWDKINQNICALMNEAVESEIVQKAIHEHYQMVSNFWIPDQKAYLGLADLYASHPDFVVYYQAYSPEYLDFLIKEMKVYAQKLP